MNRDATLFALGGWLGAVLQRLRAGRLPVPRHVNEENATSDAAIFGVKHHATDWAAARLDPVESLDQCLREIHALAHRKRWEEELWSIIVWFVPWRLPESVGLDLAKRKLCVNRLTHSWQHESVWWKLADDDGEAVRMLAQNRYVHSEFTADRIDEVLASFPRYDEIASILVRCKPDPKSKAGWLAALVRKHELSAANKRKTWHSAFAKAWAVEPT